jgi:uroporphyrinogen-III decarboxylase
MAPAQDRLLRALRREPVDRTPVWFMRQAGRYLPEYRAVRGDGDILETCLDPSKVTEITLQPLRRMPLDAAILFSDIMVPLAAIGVPVRIEPGRGRSSPRSTFRTSSTRSARSVERSTFRCWGSPGRPSHWRATSSRAALHGTTRGRRR